MFVFFTASSTTEIDRQSSQPPAAHGGDPSSWSITDVTRYIAETDAALAPFADLFRKHVRAMNTSTSLYTRLCLIKRVRNRFTLNMWWLTLSVRCLQEIDGKALLLLNSDMMMKYMGLKLGPALKLCHIVGKLKSKK